jgi:hypothetical protein
MQKASLGRGFKSTTRSISYCEGVTVLFWVHFEYLSYIKTSNALTDKIEFDGMFWHPGFTFHLALVCCPACKTLFQYTTYVDSAITEGNCDTIIQYLHYKYWKWNYIRLPIDLNHIRTHKTSQQPTAYSAMRVNPLFFCCACLLYAVWVLLWT